MTGNGARWSLQLYGEFTYIAVISLVKHGAQLPCDISRKRATAGPLHLRAAHRITILCPSEKADLVW